MKVELTRSVPASVDYADRVLAGGENNRVLLGEVLGWIMEPPLAFAELLEDLANIYLECSEEISRRKLLGSS